MSLKTAHRRRFIQQGSISANTFIGGLASSIPDAATLAGKLTHYSTGQAFSASDIYGFTIVGNDIECYISSDYKITSSSAFASCTNFEDSSHCKEIAASAVFELTSMTSLELNGLIRISGYRPFNQSSLKDLIFPNLTSCAANALSSNAAMSVEAIYIPRCTDLGGSALYNSVFVNTSQEAYIYVDSSLATNNGGAPDGDLQYAATNGAEVSYVDNFTSPNPISDLSVGNKYATAIQLVDDGTSVNPIDYYESVEVNGIAYKNVPVNGYITGLDENTSYSIQATAVDKNFNKSASNQISASTTTTLVETTDLKFSMSFEELTGSVFDLAQGNNGKISGTVIRGSTALIGNCFDFDGGKVVVPHDELLNIGENDFAFSTWIIWNSINNTALFNKRAGTSYEYQLYYANGFLKLTFFNTDGTTFEWSFNPGFITGTKYHLAARLIGGTIEFKINNVIKAGTVTGTRKTLNITNTDLTMGLSVWNSSPFLGKMDELRFWIGDTVPNAAYFSDEYNNGNGITL